MNARIIKSVLSKKHKDFVASIKDNAVREMVNQNSIITGGSIVSMLLKEKVNDFDYYFTDFETTVAVVTYYVNEFNRLENNTALKISIEDDCKIKIRIPSGGVAEEKSKSDKDEKYRPIFLTDNAITLSDKIQAIIRFYGDPETIHSNYDFIHCTCYWTSKDKKLVLPAAALESMLTKQLYYSGSKYPVCSFIRCRKFLKRGWYINAGQMLKICLQISELDLMDIKVLEDQLTGVDAAYFVQVLDYLKERQAKDENFHPRMPYLISIIDKMFQ